MAHIDEILQKLHPFEVKLLKAVDDDSFDFAGALKKSGLKEGQLRQVTGWLLAKDLIKQTDDTVVSKIQLTEKGLHAATAGLPEVQVLNALRERGALSIPELQKTLSHLEKKEVGSAVGFLSRITQDIEKAEDGTLKLAKESIETSPFFQVEKILKSIHDDNIDGLSELSSKWDEGLIDLLVSSKSKLLKVKEEHNIHFAFTAAGKKVRDAAKTAALPEEEAGQLTPEMLKSGNWRSVSFRRYNLGVPPPHVNPGRLNPYSEYLDHLKKQFVGLGFEEMRGSIVETEFWNMDALYMPQFHSARDIHDAYYVKTPAHAQKIKQPYFDNVAAAHENGADTGSRGWGYSFDRDKTKRLILRTQGTVLSARMLAQNPDIPGKYFAMARCFRPDVVDATHLADFNQVEGIVLGEDINLRTLLGLLDLFAREIARAKEVKFVPGYFPFTEPSVEIHIKHPVVGWMEMGGSGLLRPEVTKPLGIDVPVIAWGLGVDRMAMMALGVNDIRDLFTHDLNKLRETRIKL